jgi:hypothetical protein
MGIAMTGVNSSTLFLSIIRYSFSGGESYRDLIRRLTSVVIDVEQQVIPTLVVSHVSILQCLMSYFRNTPVERCMSIEIPMHTVIKFTPVRGGGWSESVHPLSDNNGVYSLHPVQSASEFSALTEHDDGPLSPIWGDHQPIRNPSMSSLRGSKVPPMKESL